MKLTTAATLLTAGEEIDLARRVHGTDPADSVAARNELVLHNLGLVGTATAYYARRSTMDYDDLFSEGVIALIAAAEGFDPALHFRFSTYAMPALFHAAAAAAGDRMVRLPRYIQAGVKPGGLAEARQGAKRTANRAASVAGSRRARAPVRSLDEQFGLVDLRPTPLEHASQNDDVRQMLCALSTLPPLRAYLLASRLGLYGIQPRTLNSLGSELGLCRERIRQIVAETTAKLARQLQILAPEEII